MKEIITELSVLRDTAEPIKYLSSSEETMLEADAEKQLAKTICAELREVLESNKALQALSAPQIGYKKRIFGIKFEDGIKFFIDPVMKKRDPKSSEILPELFASMPQKEILICRPNEIIVVYTTENFKYEENKLKGIAARLFEQQLQVLDGVLPDVLGVVTDTTTDGKLADLTEKEYEEVIKIYKELIKLRAENYKKEISLNDEDKKVFDMLKYSEKVISGEIKVVNPELDTVARKNKQIAKKAEAKSKLFEHLAKRPSHKSKLKH